MRTIECIVISRQLTLVLRPQAGIPCATPSPSLENRCQDVENGFNGGNVELVCGSIQFFLVVLLTCSYFPSAKTTYVVGWVSQIFTPSGTIVKGCMSFPQTALLQGSRTHQSPSTPQSIVCKRRSSSPCLPYQNSTGCSNSQIVMPPWTVVSRYMPFP